VSGAVKCWGGNTWGALGDGTGFDRSSPVASVGLATGVQALTAGDGHTCALMDDATVKCWGFNLYGQLGDNTLVDRLTATTVPGLSNIVAISAGSSHTCAVDSAGEVRCWGQNDVGQIDCSGSNRKVPTRIAGF